MSDLNFCPNCGHNLTEYINIEIDEKQLFNAALEIINQKGFASTSLLQRELKIGYGRAARYIERMEDEGLVGPYELSSKRKIHSKLIEERLFKELPEQA